MTISEKLSTKKTILLSLGALGVVFGDIGTSPLYAVTEIFETTHALDETKNSVIGGISLIIWALFITITIKYIVFVLRADQRGEGGTFALFAILRKYRKSFTPLILGALVVSAGFLMGEGVITPAISVLASVEGLSLVHENFSHIVIPLTLAILTVLFIAQSKGTHKVGKLFGPITLIWFITIGSLGVFRIIETPEILQALNPLNISHAFDHFTGRSFLLLMGSVILVITGGEALYADLGHFGKRPIRISWLGIVFPMLILNYLGQGAYIISGSKIIDSNIFYSFVPKPLLIPVVIIATFATVIASQALITGAFSIASQGMALSLIPRMRIVHTNREHMGQIYIPFINWALYLGAVLLVLVFKSSANLAAAYGLAVSVVMLNTSIAVLVIALGIWKWNKFLTVPLFSSFIFIDLTFLFSNLIKFLHGGYVPIFIGVTLATIMLTWNWGRRKVRNATWDMETMSMSKFMEVKQEAPHDIPRSIIMLTPDHPTSLEDKVPLIATSFVDRFHFVPSHLVLLTVRQKRYSHIPPEQKYDIIEFDNDLENDRSLLSIQVNFGFMDEVSATDIINDLAKNHKLAAHDDPSLWVIHAMKERIVVNTQAKGFKRFRYGLFRTLARQAQPAYNYFGLDDDSRLTVELVTVPV
ncbi:MAG: KUP/HAK/KT family potassium transporter [Acidimicrobiia bacterium]